MIPYAAMKCPGANECPHVRSQEVLLAQIKKERAEQAEVMTAMKAELNALKRMVYGRKSEKMPPIAKELRRVPENSLHHRGSAENNSGLEI